jgi:DNA polymerase delta subunit 1
LGIAEALAFDLDSHESLKRALHQFSEPILSIETVKATSVMGFEGCSNQQQTFLKQRVASPLLLRPLRSCWERRALSLQREGIPQITVGGNTPTFNSNLDPVLQFMVDKGLSGCQWCSVPLSHAATRTTRCHYELEASADALCVLPARDDLAPLRLLSFDLEAAGRRGVFPDPTIDPVIQISVHMEPPSSEQQLLLSFKECHPIPGATVLSFEREESLLLAFRDVVCAYDPDLLTGFNILNFDLEYLQKRAQALGIGSEFACMTRLRPPKRERAQGPQYMQVKERFFQSAQVLFP